MYWLIASVGDWFELGVPLCYSCIVDGWSCTWYSYSVTGVCMQSGLSYWCLPHWIAC